MASDDPTMRPDAVPGVTVGETQTSGGSATTRKTKAVLPPIPDVTLECELGRGGMGVVWRGRQTWIDRPVAVKFLLGTADDGDDQWIRRFQREAKLLAGLHHPHIVACHQAGLVDGTPYLVMEFIDGPNLKTWLIQNGPMPVREALRIIAETARALHHAQLAGIIHRDVKPENVLLAPRAAGGTSRTGTSGTTPGGTATATKGATATSAPTVVATATALGASDDFPFVAKLADLGLARPQLNEGSANLALTKQGAVLGTPATMAPEQFDDPDQVDHRADIYGLGCVFYHALTGQAAFLGKTMAQLVTTKLQGAVPDPAQVRKDLPAAVADLARRMLARDRDLRPQTYEEIWTTCERLMRSPGGRRSWTVPMAVAAVVAIGIGIVAAVALRQGSPAPATSSATMPNTPGATAPSAPAPITPPPLTTPTIAPTPDPGEATFTPGPLLDGDQADRLKHWQVLPGANWQADEERDNAISGTTGAIIRPIPAGAKAMAGTFHLPPETRPFEQICVGVVNGDGSIAVLSLKNFGQTLLPTLDRAGSLTDAVLESKISGQSMAQAVDIPFLVRWDGGRVRGTVGGTEQLSALSLALRPVNLVVLIKGKKGPVTISGLRTVIP